MPGKVRDFDEDWRVAILYSEIAIAMCMNLKV